MLMISVCVCLQNSQRGELCENSVNFNMCCSKAEGFLPLLFSLMFWPGIEPRTLIELASIQIHYSIYRMYQAP